MPHLLLTLLLALLTALLTAPVVVVGAVRVPREGDAAARHAVGLAPGLQQHHQPGLHQQGQHQHGLQGRIPGIQVAARSNLLAYAAAQVSGR